MGYEILVGRDEKSVELGFHGVIGSGQGAPGMLEDHQQGRLRNAATPKGVFSKAVRLIVDDTESLWNSPPFPEWNESGEVKSKEGQHRDKREPAAAKDVGRQRKQKKIHLVLLTHGLHSNLGADMLFMKENIDAVAKQARDEAKRSRAERRARRMTESTEFARTAVDGRSKSVPEIAVSGAQGPTDESTDSEDEEEVFVRGFTGNTVKTERGIQYLGKRFAKYVLSITYPDQPYLPIKSSMGKSLAKSISVSKPSPQEGTHPTHKNSSIIKDENHRNHNLPYRITSISFISHSLGGLVQTYAIAYIQKHSPEFFNLIKPVNFVALATPFLGLSNENPVYVKFALDFGLVGRTGQDLGLTWRPPTLAKSGWGAVIGGLTTDAQKGQREPDPGAKPLLRILPTGPAHMALKKFRNRTVYSNVVNDGIVPLRTSCLLFLDWRGLERVEKARRESGLVGTMVGWGWAEMTGQNASNPRKAMAWNNLFSDSGDEVSNTGKSSPDPQSSVPQAEASQGFDYDTRAEPEEGQFLEKKLLPVAERTTEPGVTATSAPNLWTELLNFFRPHAGRHQSPPGSPPRSPRKTQKIYRRGQTMHHHLGDSEESSHEEPQDHSNNSDEGKNGRQGLVRGSSLYTNSSETGEVEAPPRTTFFESAGDVLSPPLPSRDFIINPAARPRTIFHDRVYHPQDIPPPPAKRQRTFMMKRSGSRDPALPSQQSLSAPQSPTGTRRSSSSQSTMSSQTQTQAQNVGTMKIEEKIARAYHKDLSWRKVLVRLEPDAHNNMVVRRMFANAYGWPVVKHLCDTHFGYTAAAKTRDEDESNRERAKSRDESVGEEGETVRGQRDAPKERSAEDTGKREEGEEKARTTDDVAVTAMSPQDVENVHSDLQKLHTQWKVRSPGSRKSSKRTESELREARDDVSELVSRVSATGESSYTSMNSGKAALSRLARQDSARWSDRFFDGSSDGEEDDDDEEEGVLREELNRARMRGELEKRFDMGFEVEGKSGKARIAESLTESPEQTRLSAPRKGKDANVENVRMITAPDVPLSAEPAELEPLSHSEGSSASSKAATSQRPDTDGNEHEQLEPGSLTALSTGGGLGLSLGENVDERRHRETNAGNVPESESGRRDSLGVAEQVALAQRRKETQGRSASNE